MPTFLRRFATSLAVAITILVGFAAAPASAATAPHLSYYGGRVLSHVKVDLVVWDRWSYSSTVPLTGKRSMSSFFRGITASKYIDWLSEYNTPTQRIGRGSLEGVYTVHPPSSANGTRVSDTQINGALRTLIDAGKIPKPSTDRVYTISSDPVKPSSRPMGTPRTTSAPITTRPRTSRRRPTTQSSRTKSPIAAVERHRPTSTALRPSCRTSSSRPSPIPGSASTSWRGTTASTASRPTSAPDPRRG